MVLHFPKAWFSVALKGYRDHPEPYRTYSQFLYESLPPLPETAFDGSFSWLPRKRGIVPTGKSRFESAYPRVLERVAIESKGLRANIPESFLAFMRSVDLVNCIRSATDCSFDLAERLVPLPWASGHLLRFLADSQGCLFWYLFIKQQEEACVLVTSKYYGGDPTSDREFMEEHLGPDWNREDPPQKWHKIWFCAPNFESFLYRFWMENEIWYAFEQTGCSIGEDQARYLLHYKQTAVGATVANPPLTNG